MDDLVNMNTSIFILQAFDEHLTQLLTIPSLNRFNPVKDDHDVHTHINSATKHQNKIGWENFTRGYISNKWKEIQQIMAPNTNQQRNKDNWGTALIKTALS